METITEPMFRAEVTQFLRPNGRRRETSTELPMSSRALYDEMLASGCRFEAEILTNGMASITVSDPKAEEDLDISITPNGPEVQAGMIKLLERQSWKRLPAEERNEEDAR